MPARLTPYAGAAASDVIAHGVACPGRHCRARHKDAGLPDHIRQTALHGYHIVVGAKVQRPTIALKTCGSLSPSMTCTRQTPRSQPVNVSVTDAAMRLATMRPPES